MKVIKSALDITLSDKVIFTIGEEEEPVGPINIDGIVPLDNNMVSIDGYHLHNGDEFSHVLDFDDSVLIIEEKYNG